MEARLKVQEANAVKARIRLVNFLGFQDQQLSQTCPFPGFGTTALGRRPPRELEFVGRPVEYREVMKRVVQVDEVSNSGLVITGPSGSGKSCILRAVAVELIGRCPANYRVICMWYLDARRNLVEQVQDSLLFTFSDAGDAVLDKILAILTPEALSEFLKERRSYGDFLCFVSDGDENYDAQHKDGSQRKDEEARRRSLAKRWLEAFEGSCDFVIKTVSPGANKATEVPKLMQQYEVGANFGQEEYASFLSHASILGAMLERHPERKDDVALFAGQHPMSLYFLSKACDEYVRHITGPPPCKRRFGITLLDPRTGAEVEYLQVEHPETLLDDDHVWEEVLARFQDGQPFSEIREFVKSYNGPEELLPSPASVFRRFVGKDGAFCTDFIQAVHLEAALERLKGTIYRSEAFRAYVKMKLEKFGRKVVGPARDL